MGKEIWTWIVIGLAIATMGLLINTFLLIPTLPVARTLPCDPAFVIQTHPGWTLEQGNLVCSKRVAVGMTTEMVLASWGYPDGAEEASMGSSERWTYRIMYRTYRLYFESGILKSIED